MAWLSRFLDQQAQGLLTNNRQAVLHAVAFSLLPYTAWLSMAIIALVTLRKGAQAGGRLLLPVLLLVTVLSAVSTTVWIAVINATLTFVPCYLAACVLRKTVSWRAVMVFFLLQFLLIVLLLQIIVPDFIMAQFVYLQTVLHEVDADNALLTFIHDKTGLDQMMLAGYLLGLQAVGVIFSACMSLSMARSIQSRLFYPGAFKKEILTFRGDKIGLLVLGILLFATREQSVVATCMVPLFVFYFLLAGLSLSLAVLVKQKPLGSVVLLTATLLLLPFIMLPVYVIFGSLDSLFNFRLYLPSR